MRDDWRHGCAGCLLTATACAGLRWLRWSRSTWSVAGSAVSVPGWKPTSRSSRNLGPWIACRPLGPRGPSGWRGEMTAQVILEQQLAIACRPARGHLGHLDTPFQAWENGRKLRNCSHQSVLQFGTMELGQDAAR